MGFVRKSGGDRGTEEFTISSLALAIGDLVAFDTGNYKVIKATSASQIFDLAGIVQETTTTSDTKVLVERIYAGDKYEVGVANNSNTTHNYQLMVLTDHDTVNNTGTTDATDEAVFRQIEAVGVNTDKKIIGEFVTVGNIA